MKTFTHEWKFYPKYPTNKRMLTNTSRHCILITWITDTVKNNENVFLLKLNVYQIDQSNVKRGWMYLAQMFPLICQPQRRHTSASCVPDVKCVFWHLDHMWPTRCSVEVTYSLSPVIWGHVRLRQTFAGVLTETAGWKIFTFRPTLVSTLYIQ